MRSLCCLLLIAAVTQGCFHNMPDFDDHDRGGIERAAFEMDCPEDQLQVTDLGRDTVGVTGCGKKTVYKWLVGTGWVNNTAAPAQAP